MSSAFASYQSLKQTFSQSKKDFQNAVSYFKQTELTEIAIEILKLSTQTMKKGLAEFEIIKASTRELHFFQSLILERGREAHNQFCRHAEYLFVEKDQLIFKQGDPSDKFYVLIKGEGHILMDHKERIIDANGDYKLIIHPEVVNIIQEGHSISEFIQMKDEKRKAGLRCSQDSHFLVLDKNQFNQIVADMEIIEQHRRVSFLHGLKVFEVFQRNQLEQIMPYFSKIKIKRDQMLAIENNYADSIYIIVKGEFSLTKVVSFPVSDTTCAPRKLTNGNMSGDFIKEMKLKSTKKSVHITTIGSGEMCCEVDSIRDMPQQYTIKCISQEADVFKLSNFHFFKRVIPFGQYYDLKSFKQLFIEEKMIWRQQRILVIKSFVSGNASLLQGTPLLKNWLVKASNTMPSSETNIPENLPTNKSPQTAIPHGSDPLLDSPPKPRSQLIFRTPKSATKRQLNNCILTPATPPVGASSQQTNINHPENEDKGLNVNLANAEPLTNAQIRLKRSISNKERQFTSPKETVTAQQKTQQTYDFENDKYLEHKPVKQNNEQSNNTNNKSLVFLFNESLDASLKERINRNRLRSEGSQRSDRQKSMLSLSFQQRNGYDLEETASRNCSEKNSSKNIMGRILILRKANSFLNGTDACPQTSRPTESRDSSRSLQNSEFQNPFLIELMRRRDNLNKALSKPTLQVANIKQSKDDSTNEYYAPTPSSGLRSTGTIGYEIQGHKVEISTCKMKISNVSPKKRNSKILIASKPTNE